MIPLPLMPNRQELLSNLLKKSKNSITCEQLKEIARLTEGYSGSDLTQLTKDAAMTPLREMTSQQITRYPQLPLRNVVLIRFFGKFNHYVIKL